MQKWAKTLYYKKLAMYYMLCYNIIKVLGEVWCGFMLKVVMTDINSVHDSDFVYDYPDGFDHWLLLHTNTAALFRLRGVDYEVGRSTMVLFPPGEPVYYRAIEDTYADDWLFFTAEKNDLCVSTLPICTPINDPLPVMVRALFQFLCVENACISPYKETNVDYCIRILINKLVEFNGKHKVTHKYYDLISLRQRIYAEPGLFSSVSDMADYMHISKGRLQTIYKEAFGISCVGDIIAARIRYAKYKLVCSDMSLAGISLECGYKNIEHFFRQFKKQTGYSPKEYRKQAQDIGF